ncbi:MAG: DUF1543 domain-containing protein [Parvularcula sp.]|jgi:hypothetical protein|nr:DUF1543 domain-containing protein [Parvularcula sp.]
MDRQASLFVVIVGGYPPGAHTEVHDTRFFIGRQLEDGFAALKEKWWGGEDRFHLDAWGALHHADGHDILIGGDPPQGAASDRHLFYVQLGGYREGVFGELHSDVFVVAADKAEAKRRALKLAPKGWASAHRDTMFAIESIVDVAARLDLALPEEQIHLVPANEAKPFRFEARYLPLPGG